MQLEVDLNAAAQFLSNDYSANKKKLNYGVADGEEYAQHYKTYKDNNGVTHSNLCLTAIMELQLECFVKDHTEVNY